MPCSVLARDVAGDALHDHVERDEVVPALEHDDVRVLAARLNVLLVLTRWVKQTKNWHPIVFIGLSALVGVVFRRRSRRKF